MSQLLRYHIWKEHDSVRSVGPQSVHLLGTKLSRKAQVLWYLGLS